MDVEKVHDFEGVIQRMRQLLIIKIQLKIHLSEQVSTQAQMFQALVTWLYMKRPKNCCKEAIMMVKVLIKTQRQMA